MPSLPTDGKGGSNKETKYEIMPTFTYLTYKMKMSFYELMDTPYPILLSYLKHNRIFDLQQTEEGRKYLEQVERSKHTEADLDSIRKLTGYKRK